MKKKFEFKYIIAIILFLIALTYIIIFMPSCETTKKNQTLVIYSNFGEVINEFDLDEITYDIYPDEENPDNEYEDVEIHCNNGDIYIYYNHPYEIKGVGK